MKKIIFFGAGKIADVISNYFDASDEFSIEAFTCDPEYCNEKEYKGRPLIPFDQLESKFPPEDYKCFVGVGYQGLNDLRAEKFEQVKAKGYEVASYIPESVKRLNGFKFGENCFVMDGSHIQPYVTLGKNVFVFSGALVSHHSTINDHVWITSGANVAGSVSVGEKSFLAVNATLTHQISVGRRCFLGANSLVNKDLADESVVIEKPTELFRLKTDKFLKFFNFS